MDRREALKTLMIVPPTAAARPFGCSASGEPFWIGDTGDHKPVTEDSFREKHHVSVTFTSETPLSEFEQMELREAWREAVQALIGPDGLVTLVGARGQVLNRRGIMVSR